MNDYSEDSLVEQPAIELFRKLGWETANCFYEKVGSNGTLGRDATSEVVLVPRLRSALVHLNPDLPSEAIELAIEELKRDRSVMSPSNANREVYHLLKNGVKVTFRGKENEETVENIQVIDWNEPSNNDFFLASQFWVTGEMYKRRADLVGFVNGLPLIFIELKASHKRMEHAYRDNLRDYKNAIPQIFWYNGLIILSNGSQSKIGSMTAEWEHFAEWKKINSEGEEGIVSLDTMIRGTCDPVHLLDIVENFTLFSEASGGIVKLVAKNHQYLGVNNATEALKQIENNSGRLGVFWHTQGSGKSFSMVFFSQKVLRKIPGNFTFLIVTDRLDLDNQIYKNFAGTGAVTEEEVQAENGDHLKELLREDHRYIFTLIQKFHTKKGETYPMLSDRKDIIVITDEAHRSQYDTLALNMRNALPKAAFIAFTGTPLIFGEEKTKEVFGDYVSIYNFKQSVDDGATVALYYENRIPELQLTNKELNEDLQQVIDEAELDPDQENKLEREFAREYHLITRDDRLDKIARDIVAHFMGRGQFGKAMVISIDKATAVRMYDKVQKYWKLYLKDLQAKLVKCADSQKKELEEKIKFMEETDMAVVVSQSQNEIEDFKKKGLDIAVHRKRIVKEDLDKKFKDSDDPFRIVFVCAMWMTGFDVPSCSTIYLDKPMRNHTLMQTIARANRVFGEKSNGLVVDYVGVFRNLQKALAIYGSGGGINEGETPVKDKSVLVEQLKNAILETTAFCTERGIDIPRIQTVYGFDRIKLIDDAIDAILTSDESKTKYLSMAATVVRIYRSILPDAAANEFYPMQALFGKLAEKIRGMAIEADISGVMKAVDELLDDSISTEGYVIRQPLEPSDTDHLVDLSRIDFEALKARFEKSRKHIETEKLRSAINLKLVQMVRLNKSRTNYLEKFQKMIDEYNSSSYNVETFFASLVEFAQELNAEEKRGIAEKLTEEELAIFDLLVKPEMTLKKKEEQEVKKVAQELLVILKKEKLVLDWRKRQQSRAAVRLSIDEILDKLPRSYIPDLYRHKCDLVYQHVYDSYFGQGLSIYAHPG
ncbi:MAG: type I restriction endonuclease subunit R [Candidatus Methanoperedens sp.]|uniref:type I restriction endonuclease subunit R n=1 Tax=Candidatus Methanoperedens sp. BLZ2 TaxID=2035255 RepID=UPI000BE31390|nr:type I restriction endonuclease subunit R [Candidatus Methanoperedens sp. BLZ2]KAB2941881.1 MAG: type I restriction endonuclease subunit R [Candidatus Methanoperedens sp.]MBZ0175960.1 type I restriction endonuclease subunit R [Candidatus Methanoperedens nitroreducens]MCX9078997.1 type I restriction endonuclease subunit R [Candidatus Methanoperedens sp.]